MDDKNYNLNGFDSVENSSGKEAEHENNAQAFRDTTEFHQSNMDTGAGKPQTEDTGYHFNKSEIMQDDVGHSYSPEGTESQSFGDQQQNGAYTQGSPNEYSYVPNGFHSSDENQLKYPHRPDDPKPPKKKREKRRFGAIALIAFTLCAALIGGAASSVITTRFLTSKGGTNTISSQNNGTAAKTINIESTSTTVVEAVAEKVTPSVVGIRSSALADSNPFFGNSQTSTGEGSGIIYSTDGYILTNYHVIQIAVESRSQSAKVEVFLPSSPETAITADVVGYESSSDLAVLKISKRGLPAIELGDSDSLKVGETAIAVGNPGGLKFMGSVSGGYISGLNRTIQLDNALSMTLIQTDAAINPGNSGGALVNAKGQLIGINSAKMAADGFEGMGFAIPVNKAVEICNNIITNKDVPKPYIGIEISTKYDSNTLLQMGYPSGVVVSGVTSGGPAETAGIESGDIITKLDKTAVTSYAELSSQIGKHKVGDIITLSVYRSGKTSSIKVTLSASNG